jgi:uncharacterized protein YndB with AHSA1/START domain
MIRIEIKTNIKRPIEEVFDRLTDLSGYNVWMSRTGLFRSCKKTSEGPIESGTTFTDKIRQGRSIGEISEISRPKMIKFRQTVYFKGMPLMESRPGYILESDNGMTRLHHVAEGELYGIFKILEPIIRIIARRERNITVTALKRSLEPAEKGD